MQSKATMVGKGTWNHTKSHKSEADSSPALETEVTSQTNSPVDHCINTRIYKDTAKLSKSLTAQSPFSHPAGSGMKVVPTAPEECFPQMKQFRTKQIPKTTPGYRVAVCKSNHTLRENT